MKIFVDADACPRVIRDILQKAAIRKKIEIIFVANTPLSLPYSRYLKQVIVSKGFDVADDKIVELVTDRDLVITADIPLANQVIEKKGGALNPRGTLYTVNNIGQYLAVRNVMDELRSTQLVGGGPPPLGDKEKHAFSKELDKWLEKNTPSV